MPKQTRKRALEMTPSPTTEAILSPSQQVAALRKKFAEDLAGIKRDALKDLRTQLKASQDETSRIQGEIDSLEGNEEGTTQAAPKQTRLHLGELVKGSDEWKGYETQILQALSKHTNGISGKGITRDEMKNENITIEKRINLVRDSMLTSKQIKKTGELAKTLYFLK